MTDDQKQRYASIARQVGAGLASVYGILILSGATSKEPSWFTILLTALGPFVQVLEHSSLSPGGPTPTVEIDGPAPAMVIPQMTHTVTEGTPIAPLPQPSSTNVAAGSPPSPIRPV